MISQCAWLAAPYGDFPLRNFLPSSKWNEKETKQQPQQYKWKKLSATTSVQAQRPKQSPKWFQPDIIWTLNNNKISNVIIGARCGSMRALSWWNTAQASINDRKKSINNWLKPSLTLTLRPPFGSNRTNEYKYSPSFWFTQLGDMAGGHKAFVSPKNNCV